MKLTVGDIAQAVNGKVVTSGPAADGLSALATGMTWDSRAVQPGDLYVALPGERVDGHDFAQAAVEAGAAAVLASRGIDVDVPVVLVEDTARALTDLASHWRNRLKGTVVGLTGSTGKTTTKGLVRDVLETAGTVVATKANQNNELGVPATILAADEDTDFVVVEMGMRGMGQIEELCQVARPDWGLVTNVGECHIELLGSRENIARAKSELLAALPEDGIAFVNAADELLPDLLAFGQVEEHGVRIVKFNEDVRAEDIELDEEGRPSFTLCASGHLVAAGGPALPDGDSVAGNDDGHVAHASEGKPKKDAGSKAAGKCEGAAEKRAAGVKVKLALRGMHNVSNACSATAVGLAAGMTLSQCAEALASAQPEKGRQQVLHTVGGLTVVDDAYNANPDSMRASLSTFAALDVPGRHIAVLGDMLELGSFAEECHERIGTQAAQSGIDYLICVGKLSRSIAKAACEAGMEEGRIVLCDDAAQALREVLNVAASGDAVLVKASHSIGLDAVVEGLVG